MYLSMRNFGILWRTTKGMTMQKSGFPLIVPMFGHYSVFIPWETILSLNSWRFQGNHKSAHMDGVSAYKIHCQIPLSQLCKLYLYIFPVRTLIKAFQAEKDIAWWYCLRGETQDTKSERGEIYEMNWMHPPN